jgi:hypothetical protein
LIGPFESQRYIQKAIAADLWISEAQLDSGNLPYFFRPSDGDTDIKDHLLLPQLNAAERLIRVSQQRHRLKPVSSALNETLLSRTSKPSAPSPDGHQLVAPLSLGERAVQLRLMLGIDNLSSITHLSLDDEASLLRQHLRSTLHRHAQGSPNFSQQDFSDRFFVSHAALALVQHNQYKGCEESVSAAQRALAWLATWYTDSEQDRFHPTLAPWHAFAIAKQFKTLGKKDHVQLLFFLADRLIDLQADADFPGRFYTPGDARFGATNVVRDALSTLVLMEALTIAGQLDDQRLQRKYRKAIWLALDNLTSLQYQYGAVDAFPEPSKAIGALRFQHNDERIRLDGVIFGAEAFDHAARLIEAGFLY